METLKIKIKSLFNNFLNYSLLFLPFTLYIIAGILAYHDKSGWGWFLIAGFLSD